MDQGRQELTAVVPPKRQAPLCAAPKPVIATPRSEGASQLRVDRGRTRPAFTLACRRGGRTSPHRAPKSRARRRSVTSPYNSDGSCCRRGARDLRKGRVAQLDTVWVRHNRSDGGGMLFAARVLGIRRLYDGSFEAWSASPRRVSVETPAANGVDPNTAASWTG